MFESDHEARQAEAALSAPARAIADPRALREGSGVLGTITRLVKGAFGGERQEAERYAIHLEHGRVVLAVPSHRREDAERLTRVLVQHGGFDITYFGGVTIEEMSPIADARHGVPAHDAGTAADARSTGHTPVEHG